MPDKKVVRINHGKMFGKKQWYTFHCPECSNTLTDNTLPTCARCNTKLTWNKE